MGADRNRRCRSKGPSNGPFLHSLSRKTEGITYSRQALEDIVSDERGDKRTVQHFPTGGQRYAEIDAHMQLHL